jgi:hypothetical protein
MVDLGQKGYAMRTFFILYRFGIHLKTIKKPI